MKKLFLLLFLVSFAMPLQADEFSSDEKLRELKDYGDETTVDQSTLAAPLLLSQASLGKVTAFSRHLSLFDIPHTVGVKGEILYEQRDELGVRLEFRDLKEEAAFFWLFERPMDLRNRWVRVHYSGLRVPSCLKLEFDHDELRSDSQFDLYLENTLIGDTVYFKLPDKTAFAKIETLRLVLDPDSLEHNSADFVIHAIELVPAGEDPLGGFESDLSRFDWYAEPLKPENRASFNTNYTF